MTQEMPTKVILSRLHELATLPAHSPAPEWLPTGNWAEGISELCRAAEELFHSQLETIRFMTQVAAKHEIECRLLLQELDQARRLIHPDLPPGKKP